MLLSLSIWGSIWGPVGMLLAVPMMVVLMIVFSQFHATRHIAILMSADGNVASDGSHTPGPTAQPAQSTGSS
jgi:predicted PurR-regulated permease PerM